MTIRHPHSGKFIQSLDRGLELLEALAATRREMALGELSAQFDWDKSTTHRLLATLSRRGLFCRASFGEGQPGVLCSEM